MKDLNAIKLSIVICNFNTKNVLSRNLLSIKSSKIQANYEVVVVDDASTDGSGEMVKNKFPWVKLIINQNNLGYSKSYNIGTKASKGNYVLHLNSDVVIEKNIDFDNTLAYLDNNPNIGILGCKIIKSNGSLDLPCKRSLPTLQNVFYQSTGMAYFFPKNKRFGNYYLTYLDENKITPVDCLMGAFMLIRRQVFDSIGFLDERFFIYGEDIDFCLRASNAHWQLVYYPEAVVQHLHGGTTHRSKIKFIWLFHQAMILYYQKHLASRNNKLLNWLVYLAIWCRYFLTMLIGIIK